MNDFELGSAVVMGSFEDWATGKVAAKIMSEWIVKMLLSFEDNKRCYE